MIDYLTSTAELNEKQRVAWRGYESIAPCKTFLPTRPQADFADAVGRALESGQRIFAIDSGNGTGKTTGLQNVLLNIIYGKCNIYTYAKDLDDGKEYPNGFFAGTLYRKWPKNWPKLIWYISHADVLKDTVAEMENWAIPETFKKFSEGKSKHPGSIEFSGFDFLTKWRIVFKTIDQDKDAFQAANVGIVIIDERCHEWIYDFCIRRLRRGGILIHTATPIGDTGYLYERVIDKVGIDQEKWHQRVTLFSNVIGGKYTLPGQADDDGNQIVFNSAGEWDLGDFGVQKKGNLHQSEVNLIINNTSQEDIEPVILGKPRYQIGVIWPGYSIHREDIFRKQEWKPMSFYPQFRMIIDPHDAYPPAVVWVRIDRWGRRYYFREWPSVEDIQYGGRLFHEIEHVGTYDLIDFCSFFIEIEREWRLPRERIQRIIDPNFGLKPSTVPGVQSYVMEYVKASGEAYKRLGMDGQFTFITKVNDRLDFGHRKVTDALKKKVSGDMYISVSPECLNLDIALRKYKRMAVPLTFSERHGPARETPKGVAVDKKYKAFADLFRYDHVVPLSIPEVQPVGPVGGDDYGAIEEVTEDYGDETVGEPRTIW